MSRFARITIILFVVAISSSGGACSWARGYFHQVTLIRGHVVGRNLGLLHFRWLRQSFNVSEAKLTLYEFGSARKIQDLKRIAVIKTDSHGNFDFGAIPKGHYSLDITVKDSDRMGGWFDVEVTDAVKATKNITLDVSPIYPDSYRRHEFIETKV